MSLSSSSYLWHKKRHQNILSHHSMIQPRVIQRRQDPADQALALPCCMSLIHASTHHDEQLPQHPLWAPFGSLADPLQLPHSTTPRLLYPDQGSLADLSPSQASSTPTWPQCPLPPTHSRRYLSPSTQDWPLPTSPGTVAKGGWKI